MKMDEIEKAVLRKLFARRKIGRNHFRLENLMHCGWKPHEKKLVKKAVKNLVKKGLILWVKKSQKALVLNKERLVEIRQYI